MPRFVILTHDWPFLHWDFLLEEGDSLRSWRLLQRPDACGEAEISGESIPDHRIAYLDYEGPVSGHRGSVTRYEQGTYVLTSETEHSLTIQLSSEKLRGEVQICGQGRSVRFDFSKTTSLPTRLD